MCSSDLAVARHVVARLVDLYDVTGFGQFARDDGTRKPRADDGYAKRHGLNSTSNEGSGASASQ